MVKITHAKTQYRFERQSQHIVLGQVKIENNKQLTILGKDTMFNRDFRVGDYLIIGDEKRQVSEIVYDNDIQKYVVKMFEKAKKETKKPFGHLKHFKTAYTFFENITLNEESTEYLFGE